MATATRRRKPKPVPRVTHAAGSDEAIAICRGFVEQQERRRARSLADAEAALRQYQEKHTPARKLF